MMSECLTFLSFEGLQAEGQNWLICHLCGSHVLQYLGVPENLGKTARKVSLSHPCFVPRTLVKTKNWEQWSPYAGRQWTGETANRPYFAHVQGPPSLALTHTGVLGSPDNSHLPWTSKVIVNEVSLIVAWIAAWWHVRTYMHASCIHAYMHT